MINAAPVPPAQPTGLVFPPDKVYVGGTFATVNGLSIPADDVLRPLIEARGLNILLDVVQLALAKQIADEAKVTVSPEDFRAERDQTLDKLFHEADERLQDKIDEADKNKQTKQVAALREEMQQQHKSLLEQFYRQQNVTEAEFDLVLKTNAYLRKAVEPVAKGRITEELLQKRFGERYGEQVHVRHIQLARPTDSFEALRRLAAGEKFEDVAKQMSTNTQSRVLGGDLTPFGREDPRYPKQFRDVAFGLKVGQVSDLVNADNTYHIIRLEERIMPKAVKYADQREILQREMAAQFTQALVLGLREKIAETARLSLKINDPVVRQQFTDRLKAREAQVRSKEEALKEMDMEKERIRLLHPGASSQPATRPAAPVPAPPATQPAPATPPVSPTPASPTPAIPAPVTPAPVTPAPAAPARPAAPSGTRPAASAR